MKFLRLFGGSRTIDMPEVEVPPFRIGPPVPEDDEAAYKAQVRQTIMTRQAVARGLEAAGC